MEVTLRTRRAPSRLGDFTTSIRSFLCTKDDKGMIWSDNGLLPLSTPLDFAEKLGVENCFEECSGHPNITAAQGWPWVRCSRIRADFILLT